MLNHCQKLYGTVAQLLSTLLHRWLHYAVSDCEIKLSRNRVSSRFIGTDIVVDYSICSFFQHSKETPGLSVRLWALIGPEFQFLTVVIGVHMTGSVTSHPAYEMCIYSR